MSSDFIDTSFRVSSRLPLLLGDELIPTAGYAVFELVKNAHDADATTVVVELNDVHDPQHGHITVSDDGEGMNRNDLLERWMVLGTPSRKLSSKEEKRRTEKGRPFLGEKGIGRFAVHKLGNCIELITRSTDSSEFVVNIDWRDFDPEQPVFIDQIGVRITARSPKIFTGNQTGTQIEVTELRESWTRGMVRNLHRDINSICSPFDQPLEFQAVLDVEPQKKWLENLFSFDDIKDLAPYRAECLIDGDNFKVDYHFHPPGELADRLEPRKAFV